MLIAIAICEAAGVLGAAVTFPALSTWYSGLNKPGCTPPSGLFGPIWTLLYLLMGVALYMIWERSGPNKREAVNMFYIQLALNIVWSLTFFGLHNTFYALVVIAALWVAILVTIMEFDKLSRNAALLLVPYIIWVSFAAFLNYYIWKLNP